MEQDDVGSDRIFLINFIMKNAVNYRLGSKFHCKPAAIMEKMLKNESKQFLLGLLDNLAKEFLRIEIYYL